jgi:hypothetical protein
MKLLARITTVLAFCVLLGSASSASAAVFVSAPCAMAYPMVSYAPAVTVYPVAVSTVVPVMSAVYYAPTVVTATYPAVYYYSAPVVIPRTVVSTTTMYTVIR